MPTSSLALLHALLWPKRSAILITRRIGGCGPKRRRAEALVGIDHGG
jgi:hypothetical protein